MIEERRAGAPHAVILVMVVVAVMLLPTMIGEQVEAITGFIAELLSPLGLFLLPVTLILIIQFLSSDSGSSIAGLFSPGDPNSIHNDGLSIGVGLFLVVVLLLLFNRISIFGGGEDDSGE